MKNKGKEVEGKIYVDKSAAPNYEISDENLEIVKELFNSIKNTQISAVEKILQNENINFWSFVDEDKMTSKIKILINI
jgi:hypothetical protein